MKKTKEVFGEGLKFRLFKPNKQSRNEPVAKLKDKFVIFNKAFCDIYLGDKKYALLHVSALDGRIVIAIEPRSDGGDNHILLSKSKYYRHIPFKIEEIAPSADIVGELTNRHSLDFKMTKTPYGVFPAVIIEESDDQ